MEEGVTIIDLINRAIQDKLFLEIEYAKNSYEKTTRIISDISISEEYGIGYIDAYCHLRDRDSTLKFLGSLKPVLCQNQGSRWKIRNLIMNLTQVSRYSIFMEKSINKVNK